jgi:hypothetical protein
MILARIEFDTDLMPGADHFCVIAHLESVEIQIARRTLSPEGSKPRSSWRSQKIEIAILRAILIITLRYGNSDEAIRSHRPRNGKSPGKLASRKVASRRLATRSRRVPKKELLFEAAGSKVNGFAQGRLTLRRYQPWPPERWRDGGLHGGVLV